jgi:hypothetical protein
MDRSPISLTLVLVVAASGCSTLTDEHAYVRENQQRECLRQPAGQIEPCLQRAEAEYAGYKKQEQRKLERDAAQAAEGARDDNPRIGVP